MNETETATTATGIEVDFTANTPLPDADAAVLDPGLPPVKEQGGQGPSHPLVDSILGVVLPEDGIGIVGKGGIEIEIGRETEKGIRNGGFHQDRGQTMLPVNPSGILSLHRHLSLSLNPCTVPSPNHRRGQSRERMENGRRSGRSG
jgi:hypothetical protein